MHKAVKMIGNFDDQDRTHFYSLLYCDDAGICWT